MKILYQIPGHMSAGPLGSAELQRRQGLLQNWAARDTTVDVADSPGGPQSIESQLEGMLSIRPMVLALLRRAQPADAVIVGCFGDPGVHALREVLDCPVIGPFEAAMHQGAQLGARLGVVTVLDSVVPMLDELTRSMGMSIVARADCSSLRARTCSSATTRIGVFSSWVVRSEASNRSPAA